MSAIAPPSPLPCASARHSTRWAATLARMSDAARDLLAFIDASPTPYHAVAETVRRLAARGLPRVRARRELWTPRPGDRRCVVRNGGSLVAFQVGSESPVEGGFRIVGAHTDSPNLRLKPLRGHDRAGLPPARGRALRRDPPAHLARPRPLARGPRDAARRATRCAPCSLDFGRPLARVPSLAIHLNRELKEKGLHLNPQTQALPLVGLEDSPTLAALVATELRAQQLADVAPDGSLAFDLMLYDVQPSAAHRRGRRVHRRAAARQPGVVSRGGVGAARRRGAPSSAARRARSCSTTTKRSAARARRARGGNVPASRRSSASSPASRAARAQGLARARARSRWSRPTWRTRCTRTSPTSTSPATSRCSAAAR